MIMPTIALILFATLSIAHRPRGQMAFKWARNRQYAQKPAGSGYGYPEYGNPINTEEPHFQYPYGAPSNTEEANAISSTENTESTTSFISSEEYDIDSTNTFEYEPENSHDQDPIIMDCVYDKCAESFNACFDDEQCKKWMKDWQENGSLNPECLPSQTEKLDEEAIATFETTDVDFDTTSNTESSTSSTQTTTSSTSNTESTYDTYGTYSTYDTTSSTSSTENTETVSTENTENTYEDFETSAIDIDTDFEASECEYTELFWNAYNCGVDNYCDQLKSEESHQYLVQSPSNYRVGANVTGSKSSSNNWTILIVALSAALGAIVMFEITRRLYVAFQDKIECQYQCQCLVLNNSMRHLKNKWEQIRGYKYEKTHDDLDAIEESDDAEMYGTGSDQDNDESITTNKDRTTDGVTYNGPLNDDSDISDDVELQRTDDDDSNTIDDQFVHNELSVEEEEEFITNQQQTDRKEQEITVEAVQEPMQEL